MFLCTLSVVIDGVPWGKLLALGTIYSYLTYKQAKNRGLPAWPFGFLCFALTLFFSHIGGIAAAITCSCYPARKTINKSSKDTDNPGINEQFTNTVRPIRLRHHFAAFSVVLSFATVSIFANIYIFQLQQQRKSSKITNPSKHQLPNLNNVNSSYLIKAPLTVIKARQILGMPNPSLNKSIPNKISNLNNTTLDTSTHDHVIYIAQKSTGLSSITDKSETNQNTNRNYIQTYSELLKIEGWSCKQHQSGTWIAAFSWLTKTGRVKYIYEVQPEYNSVQNIHGNKKLESKYLEDIFRLQIFGPAAFENEKLAIDSLLALDDLRKLLSKNENHQLSEKIFQSFLSLTPWNMIDDVTKQFSNTEFLQYTIWKNKSIIAGYNPSLSQNEIEAINMLSMIRDQANEYLMNNQLNNPAFRQYGNFPINPFTSSNRIARTGKATVQDGWSYDENCGIFRIVLPNGHACRGISQENIETPHLQPSSYEK